MKNYILLGLLTIYILWTLRFAIKFNRTDKYFDNGQRLIHNILIWVVPFIWIIVIKTLTKPTPGSSTYNKTKDKSTFSESGLGIWVDGQETTSGHHGDHY
ncbi:MAG: hypothetical protein ACKO96_27855 [Flammeovirgaceae bacterium]